MCVQPPRTAEHCRASGEQGCISLLTQSMGVARQQQSAGTRRLLNPRNPWNAHLKLAASHTLHCREQLLGVVHLHRGNEAAGVGEGCAHGWKIMEQVRAESAGAWALAFAAA